MPTQPTRPLSERDVLRTGTTMTDKKCYDCVHRGTVPGSVHSSCHHPATKGIHESPLASLAGMLGKRSGLTSLPVEGAAAQLRITAAQQGVSRGWFLWPANFDPVWLEQCEGFEHKAQRTP